MEAVAFNPEVSFSHDQRAQIAHTMATPGFQHITRIMRTTVDAFIIDLINTPEEDDTLAIARFKLAKAAASYFQRIVNRFNSEAQQFMRDSSEAKAPTDPTEGLIDLGEFSQPGEDPAGLLEGFDLNPQLLEEELSD